MSMDFTDKICPYCKDKLKAEDDVVICSKCEMPHHKDCWVENQGCTTFGCDGTIQSVSNGVMNQNVQIDLYDEPAGNSEFVFCGQCGNKMRRTDSFCTSCGARLIIAPAPAAASAPAPAPAYIPAQPAAPQYNAPPQYNPAPQQYNAPPQYNPAPQQYNVPPQYNPAQQYNAPPQYNPAQQYNAAPQYNPAPVPNGYNYTGYQTNQPDLQQALSDVYDVSTNKGISILCYFGLFLLIPLLARPNSKFVKFHANQGLICFIAGIILSILSAIPVINILSSFALVALLVLEIIGIVNCCKGEMKELPVIGKYRILK